jgi:multiple sugar transport system permease protein
VTRKARTTLGHRAVDSGHRIPAGVRRRGAPAGLARWALSAPLLLFLALFAVLPVFYGLWISLTDQTILSSDIGFIGLANYATVLSDKAFWSALWFTGWYTVVTTALVLITGFVLAVVANRRFPGKRVLFTLLLLPIMIAPALMGLMFRLALNGDTGLIPGLLRHFGLDISLFDPHAVRALLVVLEVLQWTPFTFLIIYSGLQALPAELFEAAAIDGATKLQAIRHITLPLMGPTLFAAGFLRAVDALRTFDVIYVLTGGGPGTITTSLSIYVYKMAFISGSFGVAQAAAVLILLIMTPLVPIIIGRVVAQPWSKK